MTPAKTPAKAPKVTVVQDGARLHYAVPVSLQRQNALSRVYTPWYLKPNSPTTLLAHLARRLNPQRGQRMLERSNPELNPALVHTNPLLAIRHGQARNRFPTAEDFYAWESRQTADWILRKGFPKDCNALFGFVRNIHPHLCAAARAAGLAVVVDQMIATLVEEQHQQRIQYERFPHFGPPPTAPNTSKPDPFLTIEPQTWSHATAITCASDYVKTSLLAQGIPADRIHVLPYPIQAEKYAVPDRKNRTGPVTVGFVGSCGLRKGTPYFLQVAERLRSAHVRFELVGGAQCDPKLLTSHPNVDFIGHIPRSQVLSHLHKFDILFFPSTCEGSPGAVMEAMATALPIVSTPNSGTVVRDGIEGYIRNYDDLDGLTQSLETLITNPTLRTEMGQSARTRAESFNPTTYGEGLYNVFAQALASPA